MVKVESLSGPALYQTISAQQSKDRKLDFTPNLVAAETLAIHDLENLVAIVAMEDHFGNDVGRDKIKKERLDTTAFDDQKSIDLKARAAERGNN